VSLKRIDTTWGDQSTCDICGRTLLRGEHAEPFVNGSARRRVCQLCISRALHEGWVREGAVPALDDGGSGAERKRSIFGRLRARRDPGDGAGSPPGDAAPDGGAPPRAPRERERATVHHRERDRRPVPARSRAHETRQVRAVPASGEQKIVSAINLFNGSEHRRTVSGVARSLGSPTVNVTPEAGHPSLVRIVVSWELCWYRYEVDISDEVAGVRLVDQGYELTDLSEPERHGNAVADEFGQLALPG
jgi:hypothetical protein